MCVCARVCVCMCVCVRGEGRGETRYRLNHYSRYMTVELIGKECGK